MSGRWGTAVLASPQGAWRSGNAERKLETEGEVSPGLPRVTAGFICICHAVTPILSANTWRVSVSRQLVGQAKIYHQKDVPRAAVFSPTVHTGVLVYLSTMSVVVGGAGRRDTRDEPVQSDDYQTKNSGRESGHALRD